MSCSSFCVLAPSSPPNWASHCSPSQIHPKPTLTSSSGPSPCNTAWFWLSMRVPPTPFHIFPPLGQDQSTQTRIPPVPEVPEACTLLLPVLASLHCHFPHVASEEALTIPGSVPRTGSTPKAQPFLHRQRCRRSCDPGGGFGLVRPPARFLGKMLK